MNDFKFRDSSVRYFYFNDFELPDVIVHKNLNNNEIEILGKKVKLPSIEEIRDIELNGKVIDLEYLVILPGLSTLEKRPREFIKKIIKTRESVGFKKIIYAPFVAKPLTLPILHYLGIDLLDNLKCEFLNCTNELLNMEKIFKEELKKRNIRVLVESIPDPFSKTLLRLSDMEYYSFFERFYPVTGTFLNASHFESLFRPDIQRWIKKIITNYRKPESERIAFLMPCSATKPYSKSRSHKFYRSIIENTGTHVHEIIVTSPLAIVPRELEFTYPAKNYDVPVTGYWYEDEKKMVLEALEKFFSNNKYDEIVAYIPEDLRFIENFLKEHDARYVIGNLRAEENIKKIDDILRSLKYNRVQKNRLQLEIINSISRFQFGIDFPLDGKISTRKFDEIFVYDGKEQYLYFSPLKGNLLLYKNSAEYLLSKDKYAIEIDDFIPKGSIFVAGINHATEDIREGDEVVIHHNKKVIATGTALMSYIDMLEQERGEAVKVRHIFNS